VRPQEPRHPHSAVPAGAIDIEPDRVAPEPTVEMPQGQREIGPNGQLRLMAMSKEEVIVNVSQKVEHRESNKRGLRVVRDLYESARVVQYRPGTHKGSQEC